VDIFSDILGNIEDGTLIVKSSSLDIFKLYPQLWVEKIKDHWIIALVVILVSIFALCGYLTDFFS
jgi:LPS O-antigen subunit length determinant protein (WzzB/FepE family)